MILHLLHVDFKSQNCLCFFSFSLIWLLILHHLHTAIGHPGCAFHDGVSAESEGVRFIRLREDAETGKEILTLKAFPRSKIALQSADNSGDHKYFAIHELNTTSVVVTLTRSLEDLVDRDVPKNLLKFRIICAAKNEKLEEGSYLSVTVYIEDVNDNKPEFLNTPYIVDIDENTPPGTIVFEGIQAFDRDKPNTPNSEVHFSMSTVPEQLSADGSPYFALKSPHRPLLILKKELDFDNGIRLFSLPLFAWDRGTPANQVNTTITINVKDVDDLPPKFTEGVYRTKINEFYPMTGMPIRIPLYFDPPIMAFDQDSLNATLVYDIISGNERKLFRVNPHNGIMYLQKEIDLEEESLPGNTFVLQIEARQKDNPLKKALARIEVEILDLNDNVPEFEADFYNISIVENLPTGFSVLQVNAIDRDQGENAEFLYNLREEPEASGAFRIDSRSGWITVRDDRLLDREQRKSVHLEVEALERTPSYMEDINLKRPGPSKVKVEITLLDQNDNTPKFEHGNLYEFKVPITATVGYVIGQVVALDPDEGPNGMLLYELQRPKKSGYIPFRLDNKNGTIYVAGPLRRGRIAVFVEASDQPLNPSERRFSLAVITIEVYATIDDQAIDFIGAPYEFWVGASAPLGTSVGQVRTTLIYEGEDEIMYDLLHTYSEGVPFAIEERSGIITVIRELSEFTRKIYYFEAVANYLFANSTQPLKMSRSSQPLTTVPAPDLTDEGVLITNVTIHVVAKPEARVPLRPVIEEINMNIIKFHIEENIVGGIIGQLLYKNGINIVNNDLESYRSLPAETNVTLNSRFRSRNQRQQIRKRLPRRLVQDNNIKLRYIIANQQEVINKITITEDGTLLTLTGLDRELKDKYDLTVIVEYTTGLVSGAGIYQVEIKVDDVNDNAPEFGDVSYMGLIKENSARGLEVALNKPVLISDKDLGKNAEFKVVLQGDYSEMFKVELVNQDNATVLNTPQIFDVYNLTEQWKEDFRYLEMQTDLKPINVKMNNQPFFKISYSGIKPLDREKEQIYSLKILAVDNGGLTSYANLNILIADVNDNAPMFERISVFKDSKVEIREYTNDMEIYFVESSTNLMPTMSALSSNIVIPPYFLPGSPRLHTAEGSFNNSQAARPRSRSRMRARSRITRAMLPLNKCPLFAVYEDTPVLTKILQVTATDEDFGRNAQIRYEVTAEHVDRLTQVQISNKHLNIKYFAIDKLTGDVLVNYPLIANVEIMLNITASDIDNLQDTTCLRFVVIDVNNHAPVFKKSWYSFDTQEGDYKDSVLGQVVAVDLDFGENSNISYSLSETDLPFRIKPVSGVIKIISSLDREIRDKYTFQVIATDNAEPLYRLSTYVEVEVNVLDLNDNKPEFIGYDDVTKAELYIPDVADRTMKVPLYKAFLDRNTKPGMFVKQVNAIDKDYIGNGNGLVLYSLLHQEGHGVPVFHIDSREGSITTISNFKGYNDYEHLNVTVIAADLGSPSLSSTAIVLVNLQGQAIIETTTPKMEEVLNFQNVSFFQHQYYEIQLLENNEAPTELLKINFTKDFNPETLRWSLWVEQGLEHQEESHELFEFDVKTSTLYALKSFDREQNDHYQLRLKGEKPNREARTYTHLSYPVIDERLEGLENNECRLVLKILDENDNAPKFKQSGQPIISVVPRSATFGYPITRVEAIDPDLGLNSEIRYRLLNEHSHLFGIDETSGKIRLIANIEPSNDRVYGFDVKATDRAGADDGRSSIVNVFVYIIDEKKQVRIVVAGKPVDVEKKIDALMQGLSEAIGMEVRVRLLEPHIGGLEPATDAYIYAVDYRSNSVVEMEQLQESLAAIQLDTLQHHQQQQLLQNNPNGPWDSSKAMPRIIELAEFGQLPRKSTHSATFWSSLEIVAIVLVAFCGIGAALTAMCFMCMRQKRGLWSQQEFPSSETGLTYTIARAGLDSCRRRHHQTQTVTQDPHLQQLQRQSQQSLCSSGKTQSTAVATQKLSQDWSAAKLQSPQHHQTQPLSQSHSSLSKQHSSSSSHYHHQHAHHHHSHNNSNNQQTQQTQNNTQHQYVPQIQHQHQHHHQHLNNDQRQREYIDVPLPKSVVKSAALRNANNSLDDDVNNSSPFVLKYNACQPVNNLSPHSFETSMFSLHSNGQDSGVDFLSSRELYETSPDSFDSQARKGTHQSLCPRHAKEHHVTLKHNKANLITINSKMDINNTDSSDNYEDSLQNDDALVVTNCRSLCDHHLQQQQLQQRHQDLYQNSQFEKKSCVRHSFSGVKDDLMQSSPRISLRSRGHILRNSMNDLEERLHNLEQSFKRPLDYASSSSKTNNNTMNNSLKF
ncbi:cadherin-89D isoform X2 [Lucilia cuprina]|uniref:cadherin-89D isoform X2 n=1 Tax=Lucilia cuprina TaxID=7375 RepID=UPI001F051118|nr:cadherin-89D isoform X2 [Lucilia cuprina]